MKLAGKVAIVTGGSRGIGKEIALIFAKEGARIVVAARTETEGGRLPGTIYQTAREIEALGGQALPIRTDITQDEDVDNMIKKTLQQFGRVDILVNNAAANFNSRIIDLPVKRWDLLFRVNLRGTFLCTQGVLPYMMEQKSGNIICMTSPAAKRRFPPGEVAYAITKTGIELFCWGLAQEVKDYNIAVNDLYPAKAVDTDGSRVIFGERDPSLLKKPEEIAEAALWLAMQDARSFTGRSVSDDEVRELASH